MDQELVGKKPTFHKANRKVNSYRVMLYLILMMAALGLLSQVRRGEIKPLFLPTPTPTRIANSYISEAETYFAMGKIDDPNTTDDAIDTYKKALAMDPQNADVWGKLARIQTYSSALLSSNEQQNRRLQEARESIDNAVKYAPDNGTVHAIRAFVLDWSSNPALVSSEQSQKYLSDAQDEAVHALQINPDDVLALAFYAEVQLDQQKWSEAAQYAKKAVESPLGGGLMDTHRVYGTVLETLGAYRDAIIEYEAALKINPNLTFLHIKLGVIYRQLQLFPKALEYFEQAAKINEQIGVKDPMPFIGLAKTYSQTGEFYSASLNGEKALSLNPADANTYGQLGIIYFKSRNYESALPALQCAVESCTAEKNQVLSTLAANHPDWEVEPVAVKGLPLDSQEVAYYYAELGQVYAYLSRPKQNLCEQAVYVLEQVRNSKYVDPVLLQIVDESENICHRLEGAPPAP